MKALTVAEVAEIASSHRGSWYPVASGIGEDSIRTRMAKGLVAGFDPDTFESKSERGIDGKFVVSIRYVGDPDYSAERQRIIDSCDADVQTYTARRRAIMQSELDLLMLSEEPQSPLISTIALDV